ncbi:MAG: hypothetical protein AAFR26_06845 [Cyanobacteria bacterium J06626_4]
MVVDVGVVAGGAACACTDGAAAGGAVAAVFSAGVSGDVEVGVGAVAG